MSKIPYTQEYHYHLTSIASQVIATGDEKCLNWIMENMDGDGGYRHNFVLPYYKMSRLWIGGLSQGLAISAFVRAYNLYRDEKYLDSAKRAFNALTKYCIHKDNNGVWIKEYPNVPTILNGMIYAMFGVGDLLPYCNGPSQLLASTVKTLLRNLCRYDLGYWSKYDLVNHYPATPFYHWLHVIQLEALYKITGEKVFLQTSENWRKYLHTGHRRARLTRGVMLARKYGVIGSYKRLRDIKRWKER